MNTDDIIKMATEAGFNFSPMPNMLFTVRGNHAQLVNFAALVTQAERESRLVAQAENEQLKARLARSGVELHRAVLAEREACAQAVEKLKATSSAWCAEAIRARILSEQQPKSAEPTDWSAA